MMKILIYLIRPITNVNCYKTSFYCNRLIDFTEDNYVIYILTIFYLKHTLLKTIVIFRTHDCWRFFVVIIILICFILYIKKYYIFCVESYFWPCTLFLLLYMLCKMVKSNFDRLTNYKLVKMINPQLSFTSNTY